MLRFRDKHIIYLYVRERYFLFPILRYVNKTIAKLRGWLVKSLAVDVEVS